MNKNDYILEIIDELNRRNGMPEDGFFPSLKDKAYRLEAIRLMFCGLKRENQDRILQCAMESLLDQSPGIVGKTALIEGVIA